jgi:uncharacterized membrane protein
VKNHEKKLDRKYLSFQYKESVNDIENVFEKFIAEIPDEIIAINKLINENCFLRAKCKITQVILALNSIGLPSLGIQLQIVEVYLDFSKKLNALLFLKQFETELYSYMPAIINEYCRLKAYTDYIRKQPARLISI